LAEHVFTVFDGPDEGKVFIVSGRAMVLGRAKGCDAVLHDDRVSRRHCRLVPRGDGIVVIDENSANGTFVNGLLVQEQVLREGDVLDIGGSRIVYGREFPSMERMKELAAQVRRTRLAQEVAGKTTALLGATAEARLTEVLESAADAARPLAGQRGFEICVEPVSGCGGLTVDMSRLRRCLGDLVAALVGALPEAGGAPAKLSLRAGAGPSPGEVRIEVACSGSAIPPARIAALREEPACIEAERMAAEHGGRLELQPADSTETLARLRLSSAPSSSMPTAVFGP